MVLKEVLSFMFEILTILVVIVAYPLLMPFYLTVISSGAVIKAVGEMTKCGTKCSCGCFWVIVAFLPMLVVISIASYVIAMIITIGVLLAFLVSRFFTCGCIPQLKFIKGTVEFH